MSFFLFSLTEKPFVLSSAFTYLFNTFVSIFVMVDPFAAIPVYMLLTERYTPADVKKTRRKATLVALCILLAFAFTGMGVLNLFGISMSALRIAGGLLLLKFSFEHMMGGPKKIKVDEADESMHKDDISIVPLAMPLLAGPGAISTTVVQSTNATNWISFSLLLFTLILVMLTSYLTLKSSQYLFRLLGKTGLNLLGRIMGILVAGIAIQFIITGIAESFPNLLLK